MQGGFWKHSPKGSSFNAFPTSTKPRTPYASHGSRPMTRESRPTTRENLDMVLDLRPPMTSHGGHLGWCERDDPWGGCAWVERATCGFLEAALEL